MTKAEMNRRLAALGPAKVKHIERLVRETTYTPRDIWAFHIPGTISLAHVNAVFQKVRTDA